MSNDSDRFIKISDAKDLDMQELLSKYFIYKDRKCNYYASYYYSDEWLTCKEGEWNWTVMEKMPSDDLLGIIQREEKEDVLLHHSPVGVFDELEKQEAEKQLASLDRARKNTQRRVIGWDKDYNVDCYFAVDEDRDEEYVAALVNEIAQHGYEFSGEEIDLIPIFDDYRAMELYARSWGRVMAMAHGEDGNFAHVNYAWGTTQNPRKPRFCLPDFNVVIGDEDFNEIKKIEKNGTESNFFRFFVEGTLDKNMPSDGFEHMDVPIKNASTGETFTCFNVCINSYETLEEFDGVVYDRDVLSDAPKWLEDEINKIRNKLKTAPVMVAEIEVSVRR